MTAGGITAFLRARPALSFFVLALSITWIGMLPFFVFPQRLWVLFALLVPVVKFGPTIAGLWMTRVVSGGAGVRKLLGSLVPRRRNLPETALVLGLPIALSAIAQQLVPGHRFAGIGPEAAIPFLLQFVARFTVGGGLGEELGWRGFALPALQRHTGPVVSSLTIGAIWALWHLPAFWLDGSDKSGESFGSFLAIVVAFSVVFTWVHNRTDGSMFHCVSLHAMINANAEHVERSVDSLLQTASYERIHLLAWAGVALFLVAVTRGRLGLREPRLDVARAGEESSE